MLHDPVAVIGVVTKLLQFLRSLRQARPAREHPDRALFSVFLEVLPSSGSISFIRNHHGQPFDSETLHELKAFVVAWSDAEHQFRDRRLERLRKRLLARLSEYLWVVALNTFTTPRGEHAVPAEWEWEQPTRARNVFSQLSTLGGQVIAAHQELVRVGRSRTSVDPNSFAVRKAIAQ